MCLTLREDGGHAQLQHNNLAAVSVKDALVEKKKKVWKWSCRNMLLLCFTSAHSVKVCWAQSFRAKPSPIMFYTEVITFVCPSHRILTSFLNAAPSFQSVILQGPFFLILRRPFARKNKRRLNLGRFACLNGAVTSARLPAANIKHQPYRFLAVIRPLPGDCITGSSSFTFTVLQTSVSQPFGES